MFTDIASLLKKVGWSPADPDIVLPVRPPWSYP